MYQMNMVDLFMPRAAQLWALAEQYEQLAICLFFVERQTDRIKGIHRKNVRERERERERELVGSRERETL